MRSIFIRRFAALALAPSRVTGVPLISENTASFLFSECNLRGRPMLSFIRNSSPTREFSNLVHWYWIKLFVSPTRRYACCVRSRCCLLLHFYIFFFSYRLDERFHGSVVAATTAADVGRIINNDYFFFFIIGRGEIDYGMLFTMKTRARGAENSTLLRGHRELERDFNNKQNVNPTSRIFFRRAYRESIGNSRYLKINRQDY